MVKSNRYYTVKVQKLDLPDFAHLTSLRFYDYFAVKFLKQKHPHVCAIPHWFYWTVQKNRQEMSFPKYYIDQCLSTKMRFVSVPICLISPKAPGGHANSLIIDKQGKQSADFVSRYKHLPNVTARRGKGTVERFEPHGARAYEIFKDYIYEKLDTQLEVLFAETYGLEYIPPIAFCPALGPQTLEHYITESGYCATWSLWYTDMRLTYPNVDRERLVKGMFDKLHDKLTQGSLTDYLLDYARQVYAVMVTEFPHYQDFFIHYDKYNRSRFRSKAFKTFIEEMDNLVLNPLNVNAPYTIEFANSPPNATISSNKKKKRTLRRKKN
jgi:hypothetical protein